MLAVGVEPGDVHRVRVAETEVGGGGVHQLGVGGLVAGDVAGEGAGRVVGAHDEHRPDQHVAGQLLAGDQPDVGLLRIEQEVVGDGDDPGRFARVVGDLGGEQLHQAADGEMGVAALGGEELAGAHVEHGVGRDVDGRDGRRGRRAAVGVVVGAAVGGGDRGGCVGRRGDSRRRAMA